MNYKKALDDYTRLGFERMDRLKDIIDSKIIDTNDLFGYSKDYDKIEIIKNVLKSEDNLYKKLKENNFYASEQDPLKNIQLETAIYEYDKLEKYNPIKIQNNIKNLQQLYQDENLNEKINNFISNNTWSQHDLNLSELENERMNSSKLIYKTYVAFDNPENLNKENILKITNKLIENDFKGKFKFVHNTENLVTTDQLVIHAFSKEDQAIAYNTIKEMKEELNLSYLGCGIDSTGFSFTENISNGEYLTKLEQFGEKINSETFEKYKNISNPDSFRKFSYETIKENFDSIMNLLDEKQKDFFISSAPLSEDYIEKNLINNPEKPDFNLHENISENFLEKHFDNFPHDFHYSQMSSRIKLSEDFIERHIDKLNFDNIIRHQDLSLNFIEKYENKIDFNILSINQYIATNDEILQKYSDKLDWEDISRNIKNEEQFLKYEDKLDLRIFVDFNIINNPNFEKLSDEFVNNHFKELINTDYAKYFIKPEDIYNQFLKECNTPSYPNAGLFFKDIYSDNPINSTISSFFSEKIDEYEKETGISTKPEPQIATRRRYISIDLEDEY